MGAAVAARVGNVAAGGHPEPAARCARTKLLETHSPLQKLRQSETPPLPSALAARARAYVFGEPNPFLGDAAALSKGKDL